MHLLVVFATLLKINIQQELAYRADALVNILVNILWLGWEVLSLTIIFSNTQSLGGWGIGELIALLGVFRLINMLMAAIIWPNTEKFNAGMRDGTLDYTLLQPAPSLFLVTFSRITFWRVWDLVLAIVLLVIGLSLSGDSVTLAGLVFFGLLLGGGLLIFYSLWVVMMAFTFWFIKFDNNVTILQALLEAGRYPATVYPPWLRMIVTFVVPIALATTVPVQALRGELPWTRVVLFLAVALLVFAIALRTWRAGVRRYSGASS
jgi:viologen exporter family transport system permease protein